MKNVLTFLKALMIFILIINSCFEAQSSSKNVSNSNLCSEENKHYSNRRLLLSFKQSASNLKTNTLPSLTSYQNTVKSQIGNSNFQLNYIGPKDLSKAKLSNSFSKLVNLYLISIDDENYNCVDLKNLKNNLQNDPNVLNVEFDHVVKKVSLTNDFYLNTDGSEWYFGYDELWGIKKINSPNAWDFSKGENVVIAVLDTGIDYNHEDLIENIWVDPNLVFDINNDSKIDYKDLDLNFNNKIDENEIIDSSIGYDFYYRDSIPSDFDGHGTHVSGTAAASGDNEIGVVGVAYQARIMPVKVLGDFGSGFLGDVMEGIIFAAERDADVINLSLGCEACYFDVFEAVINYATELGTVVVAGAGNNSAPAGTFYPASFQNVISVGAVDYFTTTSYFSNYGYEAVDIAAPGSNIASSLSSTATYPYERMNWTDKYAHSSGTSMATPHIAGVVALMKSLDPGLAIDQVRKILKSSTTALASGKPLGTGVIDASLAVSQTLLQGKLFSSINSIDTSGSIVNINYSAFGEEFTSYQLRAYPYYSNFEDNNSIILADESSIANNLDIFGIDLPSGVYVFELRAYDAQNNFISDKKLVYVNIQMPAVMDFEARLDFTLPILTWDYPAEQLFVEKFIISVSIDGAEFEVVTEKSVNDWNRIRAGISSYGFFDASKYHGKSIQYKIVAYGLGKSSEAVFSEVLNVPVPEDTVGDDIENAKLGVFDFSALTKTNYSDNLYTGDFDFYQVIVPEHGQVIFWSEDKYYDFVRLELFDSDGVYVNDPNWTRADAFSYNDLLSLEVRPGIYYLKVSSDLYYHGDYRIFGLFKSDFTPERSIYINHSENNEIILNDQDFEAPDFQFLVNVSIPRSGIYTFETSSGAYYINGLNLVSGYENTYWVQRYYEPEEIFSVQLEAGNYTFNLAKADVHNLDGVQFKSFLDDYSGDLTEAATGFDGQISGRISSDIDVDTFRIDLTKDSLVALDIDSNFDSMLELYDSDNNLIAANNDAGFESNFDAYLEKNLVAGSYLVSVKSGRKNARGEYTLKLAKRKNSIFDGSPKNSPKSSLTIKPSAKIVSKISSSDTVDYYRIDIPKNGLLRINTQGLLDTKISLFNGNLKLLAENSLAGSFFNSELSRKISAGTYFIKVSSINDNPGSYTLTTKYLPNNNHAPSLSLPTQPVLESINSKSTKLRGHR